MDRLTYKEGNHYYSKDDCIVDVRTINEDSLNVMQNWLDQLGAYEDAEEQGLLLRLPAPLDGVERFSIDGKTTWQRVYEADKPEGGAVMNENEAIEVLKDFDKQVTAKADGAYQSTIGEKACDVAIKALEEVQQYRALGTVEDLKTMKEHGAFTGTELAQLAAMQRLREYERIGTPEECLRHNDLLDFIVDKMNPNEFEIYLQMYNALDEKGNRRASDEVN